MHIKIQSVKLINTDSTWPGDLQTVPLWGMISQETPRDALTPAAALQFNLELTQIAQMVKNLPVMLETQVWALGRKDPLEKGMATHCSILTWEIPWTEEAGKLYSMGLQRVGHDWEG